MSPMQETASINIVANNMASGPLTRITSQMGAMKRIAIGAGGAIATYFSYKNVQAASNFEKTMQKSLMMFKGVTEEQRKAMANTAQQMGEKYGVGATQAAEALYYLGSAGLDVKESQQALGDVLKYAATTNLDAAQASETALTAMKNFGYEASELEKVVSRLEMGESTAQQTTSQMAKAFEYVAPMAKKAGISLSEVEAIIGTMADAGIRGSKSGRVLRRAMVNLIKPTGQTKDALKKLGLSTKVYQKNNANMIKTLKEVFGAMKNMEKADRQAAAAKIFGTRAVAGLTAVMDEGMKDIEKHAKTIDTDTEAQRRFNEKQETMAYQASKVRAQMQNLQIQMGQALLPILKKIVGVFSSILDFFNSLPGPLQQVTSLVIAIGGPLAIVAALLPTIASGLGMMAGAMTGTVIPAISTLTSVMMANPIFAGAAVAAGVVLLMKKFGLLEPVINAITDAFEWFYNNAIKPVIDGLEWLWNNVLEPLVNFIKFTVIVYFKTWKKILTALYNFAIKPLIEGLETLFGWLKDIADIIGGVVDAIGGALDSLGNAVGDVLGGSPGGQLEESLKHAEKTAKKYTPRINRQLGKIGGVTVGVGEQRQPAGRTGDHIENKETRIEKVEVNVDKEMTPRKIKELLRSIEEVKNEENQGVGY